VIDALRSRHPEYQLAYTYFSPSAEAFAASLDVDFRDVLPFDTAAAAAVALEALQPAAIMFSKLDVWPLLAETASARGIPTALISATLAPGSSRSRGVARLLLTDAYASLDAVGAISSEDADRLIELGCRAAVVHVTGDTRFDQVIARAASADRNGTLLSPLRSDRLTLVAGSTWPADERELLPALANASRGGRGLRTIIAPHEPTPAHLAPIARWADGAGLHHATLGSPHAATADVVIVDRVGVLGELYALADIAFVGGGFHAAGLHSVLEPAAFGVPVLFGPRHQASRDARLLLDAGAASVVHDASQIGAQIDRWREGVDERERAGHSAMRLVAQNAGATARSVRLVESLVASVA
jgi:3-deoxy-D-manno-octulosonic-acid transferase